MKTLNEVKDYLCDEMERILKIYQDDKDGWMNGEYSTEVGRFNYILLKLNDIYDALQEPDPWEHDEHIRWN